MKNSLTPVTQITLPDPHCTQWGAWKLDIQTWKLTHVECPFYEIPIDEIDSPGPMLDWIFQLSAKRWVSDKDRGDLIEALRSIFDPQHNLCPFRSNRKINPRTYLQQKYSPVQPKQREGK
jgi:hypothetical protein